MAAGGEFATSKADGKDLEVGDLIWNVLEVGVKAERGGKGGPKVPVRVLGGGTLRYDRGAGLFLCRQEIKAERIPG